MGNYGRGRCGFFGDGALCVGSGEYTFLRVGSLSPVTCCEPELCRMASATLKVDRAWALRDLSVLGALAPPFWYTPSACSGGLCLILKSGQASSELAKAIRVFVVVFLCDLRDYGCYVPSVYSFPFW